MHAKLFLTVLFVEIYILIFTFTSNFSIDENVQYNQRKKYLTKYQKTPKKTDWQIIKKQKSNIFMFNQFANQKH
jgi:hypothetical protein